MKVFTPGCPYALFSVARTVSIIHLKIEETGQQNFRRNPDLENGHKYSKLHGYTAKALVTLLNKHISYLFESLAGSILVELKC